MEERIMKRVFVFVVALMFIIVGFVAAQVKAPAQTAPVTPKPAAVQTAKPAVKPPAPVFKPTPIDMSKATPAQVTAYKTANDAWLAQQQKRAQNLQSAITTLQKQLPIVQKQVTDAQAVSTAIAAKAAPAKAAPAVKK
jgi:peptidoglycan hydrolase CwlO-like protein